MKTVHQILTGLLSLLLVSCGSSRLDLKESESQPARYQAMAFQKYGRGTEFVFNESKTVVLCLTRSKPSAIHPQQQVSFFVFDLSSDTTIFEDEIVNGSVDWKDSFTLLVSTIPGMVKSEESSAGQMSGYIFDLRSRKKRSLDASGVQ
jgi:hypothetical protein